MKNRYKKLYDRIGEHNEVDVKIHECWQEKGALILRV